MARRPCIVCGTPSTGTRCPKHYQAGQGARRIRRDYSDEAARRRYLKRWIETIGYVCAGAPEMNHEPHRVDTRQRGALTVDHVTPRRSGGTTAPHNLRVLCREYNSRKG